MSKFRYNCHSAPTVDELKDDLGWMVATPEERTENAITAIMILCDKIGSLEHQISELKKTSDNIKVNETEVKSTAYKIGELMYLLNILGYSRVDRPINKTIDAPIFFYDEEIGQLIYAAPDNELVDGCVFVFAITMCSKEYIQDFFEKNKQHILSWHDEDETDWNNKSEISKINSIYLIFGTNAFPIFNVITLDELFDHLILKLDIKKGGIFDFIKEHQAEISNQYEVLNDTIEDDEKTEWDLAIDATNMILGKYEKNPINIRWFDRDDFKIEFFKLIFEG